MNLQNLEGVSVRGYYARSSPSTVPAPTYPTRKCHLIPNFRKQTD